jgi:hypothetical protein
MWDWSIAFSLLFTVATTGALVAMVLKNRRYRKEILRQANKEWNEYTNAVQQQLPRYNGGTAYVCEVYPNGRHRMRFVNIDKVTLIPSSMGKELSFSVLMDDRQISWTFTIRPGLHPSIGAYPAGRGILAVHNQQTGFIVMFEEGSQPSFGLLAEDLMNLIVAQTAGDNAVPS